MAAYATLAELKEWLSIPPATTTSDALLTRLLDDATSFLNTQMNRDTLASTGTTENRDGSGKARMMVRDIHPVTAVSSVVINGQSVPASTSWDMAGYVFDTHSIQLRGRVFDKGVQNVALSYTAGYTTIPGDVRQACIELAGFKFRTKDTSSAGWVSKSLAGETVSFSQKDVSASVRSVIDQYKAVYAV